MTENAAPMVEVTPTPNDPRPRITLRRIVAEIERFQGMAPGTLHERTRRVHIAHARQAAFYLARKYTRPRLSLPQIGDEFGMDHTTVMYGLSAVNLRLKKNHIRTVDLIKAMETKLEANQ